MQTKKKILLTYADVMANFQPVLELAGLNDELMVNRSVHGRYWQHIHVCDETAQKLGIQCQRRNSDEPPRYLNLILPGTEYNPQELDTIQKTYPFTFVH